MSAPPDVLVVGAGPAGLTTALQALDHGATVRVVERRTEQFRPSRSMMTHPRTLESLRPLGVTEELLDRGDRAPRAALHLGKRTVSVELSDVALPDTPYPHLTLLRQADLEEVLTAALVRRGVTVERGVELVGAAEDDGGARVALRTDGSTTEATCRFVAGCDGPASTVRNAAGIGFPGKPYHEEVVLADLELDGDLEPGVLHVVAEHTGLLFLFALGEQATWRMLATRPGHGGDVPFGQPGEEVPVAEVQGLLDEAGLGVQVSTLTWSARVRLQHRLAGSFRNGPLFLVGDAAHTHSPAAAQGMNTGILDAVNLGWKLAFAAGHEGAHPELLGSYGTERRPVARQVLGLTHLAFLAEASTNPVSSFLRGAVLPAAAPALPMLLRQRMLTAGVVRLLSQGWVNHRGSPLSVEGVPGGHGPRPGDRLPDMDVKHDGRLVRLHDLTARPGVHLLLERNAAAPDPAALGPHVTVHRLTSWTGRGVLAVRPDGHVGFRSSEASAGPLGAWLDLVGARGA